MPVVIKRTKGSKTKGAALRNRRTRVADPQQPQDQLIILNREETKEPRRRTKAIPKPPSPLRNAIQGVLACVALCVALGYIGMQLLGANVSSRDRATPARMPLNPRAAAASLPKGPVTNKAGLLWANPTRTTVAPPVRSRASEPEHETPAAPEGIH